MLRKPITRSFVPLLLLLLPAAAAFVGCSGGSSDGPALTSTRSGVAVDPYIEGAVFQEVAGDGTLVQRESSPSDHLGRFQFPAPLREGSRVEMKAGARGTHAGAPFGGLLKRSVGPDDGEPLVVSPLTTLLANGIEPDDLLEALWGAGLPGLTAADLLADPMAGLVGETSEVGEAKLRPLQANMAAMALMTLAGDFGLGPDALAEPDVGRLLEELVYAVQTTLDPQLRAELAAEAGAQPEHPFTLGDAIHVAAHLQRELVARLHGHTGDPATREAMDEAIHAVLGGAGPMARSVYQTRTGLESEDPGSTPSDPGPEAPPETPPEASEVPAPAQPDAQVVYDARCASCHKAGDGDPAGFAPDLAGAGALVAPKFQGNHMGATLSAAELTSLAAWLDTLSPAQPQPTDPTDPTGPPNGIALYASECAGCHGTLAGTDVPGRTAAQIRAAIGANAGGMGGILLTDAELDALAAALPGSPGPTDPPPSTDPTDPTDPTGPVDGYAVYLAGCASCHRAGSEDPTGFAPDLAGAGALVAPKLQAGHMGALLSGAEEQALAAWLDQLAGPTDPTNPTDPTGPTDPTDPPPPVGSCTACHGMPPSGNAFPNTAGAHAAHAALPTVGSDCTVCHLGAAHNGAVDLAFPATLDAGRGPATDNLDGTCSNLSCHGGQTTPEWWTGTIAVDAQCRSCHEAGTGEDNGYFSGRHTLHVQKRGYDCTVCHSTAHLADVHFTGLDTPGREGVAATTIGGAGTQVTSYTPQTGTCSTQGCHGSKRW